MPSTILITGANGNLGSTVVKKFLDAGFRVIAIDANDDHLQFARHCCGILWDECRPAGRIASPRLSDGHWHLTRPHRHRHIYFL